MTSRTCSSQCMARSCFNLLRLRLLLVALLRTATAVDDPYINGTWSPVGAWPISPIHMILLKNGKVLSYGTGPTGRSGQAFHYDVWDPSIGLDDSSSHYTMRSTTETNIFCSGQVNLPGLTGEVLILGGSQVFAGRENAGTAHTQIFDIESETLYLPGNNIHLPRWYPSVTVLATGNIVVQGGINEYRKPTNTPELYDLKEKTWRLLSNATSTVFYQGSDGVGRQGWYYPKTYLSQRNTLVQFRHDTNEIWTLDSGGIGLLKRVGTVPGLPFRKQSPSVMFERNKVLIMQEFQHASVVDLSNPDSFTSVATGSTREKRIWANAVALPNGEVLMVGGASVIQSLPSAVRYGEIWNPDTGVWRMVGAGEKSRLYHSCALLLPDATVLVGGGGPPGPERNLNAEIYEPPYLFLRNGSRAPRPAIASYSGEPKYGESINIILAGTNTKIARVSIIRFGSVTHTFNMEERAMSMPFEMLSAVSLKISFTNNRTYLPPGLYMLFVVNDAGVPSKALTVNLI